MNALILACCLALQPQANDVVQPLWPSSAELLIPVAGNTAGENGTHFRSDISVVNLRDIPQRVRFQWVPQAGGPASASVFVDIRARTEIRFDDFVADVLNTSGLGSIIITGMTSDTEIDPDAVLYVTNRIWSPQPGTVGTTSHALNAIPVGAINNPAALTIFGLRRDERYRVNVGIVNLDPTEYQSFRIENVGDPNEDYVVTLPPMTMQQIPLARAGGRHFTHHVIVRNLTVPGTTSWVAYGASIDNITGDSWSALGVLGFPVIPF